MASEIVRVNTENVTPLWPQVAPLIEPILVAVGTHDIEDVRKALLVTQAHLWVQWTGEVEAAVVTDFSSYPKGVWLRIWLMGTKPGAKIEWAKFQALLDDFKKAHGCVGTEIWGRGGWARRYMDARRDFIVLRKPG